MDTISIGYSDTLPGPLNPAAVATGAKVVSKVIRLTHTSTAEFAASVTVRVPYNTATVGPNEVPVVLYWNESIKQYDAVRVISFDRTAGMITFRTHHFTDFIVGYVNGLFAAMSGTASISGTLPIPGPIDSIDTKFRPNVDGFAVENFSTPNGVAGGGACYGLTAFAKWNFAKNNPALFTNYFGSTYPLIVNPLVANPLEMDLARELIYATLDKTQNENGSVIVDAYNAMVPLSGYDAWTAQKLVSYMVFTQLPQMLDIFTGLDFSKYPTSIGDGHSVLVYSWKQNQGFMIYDPNLPGTSQNIKFNWPKFSSYGSAGITFRLFATDAPASFYSDGDLAKLYAAAPSGSEHQFSGKISILPDKNPSQALPAGTYSIDPTTGTTIYGTINANPSSSEPLYAYFYLDDSLVGSGELVAADGSFNKKITSLLPGKTSQELLIIVAAQSDPGTSATNQSGISSDYVGTARATLVAGSKAMITITSASCTYIGTVPNFPKIPLYRVDLAGDAVGPEGVELQASSNPNNGAQATDSVKCSAWTSTSIPLSSDPAVPREQICLHAAGQPDTTSWTSSNRVEGGLALTGYAALFKQNPGYVGVAFADSPPLACH
ncbi:hypothetical protein [Paraburkholderia sp. RL17-347-BIC-D]|uniref:hypothetical protein n=1 Tax=Paraburkholderia sp. RL17-347-BIC-D TaxID=3031632 RepID=UPI0038BA0AE4